MPVWNPELYLRFEQERTRPAADLAARVPLEDAAAIVDLGCGPGNSTAVLARRFPAAHLTGIDNSSTMLERARSEGPPARWVQADIAAWQPGALFDLIFTSAALQWVPGHSELLPRFVSWLPKGGVFAMQIPFHLCSRIHRLILRTLSEGPWAGRVAAHERIFEILTPPEYYDILAPHARSVELWTTDYIHVMEDAQSIVTWVRGTGLRPYLERLDDREQACFLETLGRHVEREFPTQSDGCVLFSFPRLFAIAVR